MRDYHQLEIWQRGMDYAVEIYRFSRDLPTDERYTLVGQLRKAAVGVPLNSAEGSGCPTDPGVSSDSAQIKTLDVQ